MPSWKWRIFSTCKWVLVMATEANFACILFNRGLWSHQIFINFSVVGVLTWYPSLLWSTDVQDKDIKMNTRTDEYSFFHRKLLSVLVNHNLNGCINLKPFNKYKILLQFICVMTLYARWQVLQLSNSGFYTNVIDYSNCEKK